MENEKKEIIEIQKVEQTENIVEEQVEPNKEKNKPKQQKKGFGIASMILGIVAIVLFGIWQVSIPCGILAIIFGVLGIKAINKGMAIAGLVTGIIGLLISIFIIILLFSIGFLKGFSDGLNKNNHRYRNYHYYNYY